MQGTHLYLSRIFGMDPWLRRKCLEKASQEWCEVLHILQLKTPLDTDFGMGMSCLRPLVDGKSSVGLLLEEEEEEEVVVVVPGIKSFVPALVLFEAG